MDSSKKEAAKLRESERRAEYERKREEKLQVKLHLDRIAAQNEAAERLAAWKNSNGNRN